MYKRQVKVYAETEEVKIGDTKVLFVPWINNENEKETFKKVKKSKCKVVMGHLELNGFMATAGHFMEHGMETTPFDRFEKVYSGHYHCRSVQEPVHYLGNPYEMFWGDVNDTERGFHLWDTETFEHIPVNNPHRLHHIIYYEDTNHQTFDTRSYEDKIVKIIVRKKSDTSQFERFVDKLYSSNVAELKVVENFAIQEAADFEAFESEDTISVLDRYIDEAEIDLDKSRIHKIIQEIYQEACEQV